MADPPPPGLPPIPAAPDTWQPTPLTNPRARSRWPAVAALGIALVALVIAIAGWFRPPPAPPLPAEPVFSEQQTADAKARACEAFELVRKGITLQTQGGASDDPALRKAQSANAQLALVTGGWYLRDQLSSATPEPLAGAIGDLSAALLKLGVTALAGAQPAEANQVALTADADSSSERVEEHCQ